MPTIQPTDTDERTQISADWLFAGTGYYRYDAGYMPELPGIEHFAGRVVHPQQWPQDLDYAGKRVVVIGSGATAVTLIPAMAEKAAHVTMLQRSPSYIMSLPRKDPLAKLLLKRARTGARLRVGAAQEHLHRRRAFYQFCQRFPQRARRLIRRLTIKQLPEGYPVDVHFNPRYDPWDQRLCVVPDGDLFRSIREGKASVVTDRIETFTPNGRPARLRRRSSRPTSSSPPPACGCRRSAGSSCTSTASRSTSPRRSRSAG